MPAAIPELPLLVPESLEPVLPKPLEDEPNELPDEPMELPEELPNELPAEPPPNELPDDEPESELPPKPEDEVLLPMGVAPAIELAPPADDRGCPKKPSGRTWASPMWISFQSSLPVSGSR